MMGETFKYCASVAVALGYSVEDVVEAVDLMANRGIKATQAGSAMQTMLTKLQGELELSSVTFGEVTVATLRATAPCVNWEISSETSNTFPTNTIKSRY